MRQVTGDSRRDEVPGAVARSRLFDFSTRLVSRRRSLFTHLPSPATERSLTLNLNRVDALSRLLARQPSRRRALLLIGGLLAAPWLGIDATQAGKKKRRKKNKKRSLCFKGKTVQAAGKKKKTLLKRGATTGACPESKPTPPPVSPLPPGECTPTCDSNRCDNDDGCGGVCACTAGSICHEGSCRPCTVTCNGDARQCGQNLQAAITAGGTILICPGRYGGNFQIVANRAVLVEQARSVLEDARARIESTRDRAAVEASARRMLG